MRRRSGFSSVAARILHPEEVGRRRSSVRSACSLRTTSNWAWRGRPWGRGGGEFGAGGEGRRPWGRAVAGEGGGGEFGAGEGRRRKWMSTDHESTPMSDGNEASAAVAQAEAAGREAARAADRKLGNGGATTEANGGGGRGGEDKNSSSQRQNGAVAGERDGAVVSSDGGAHGFSRPEMHSEALVGTVQYFERHVFLCCKGPESWPSVVEAASEQFDRLPNHLAGALKARKNDLPRKTRLTVCEEGSDSSGDVLVFPEMVRYKGLTDADVDEFVEVALIGGKEWKRSESLSGSHVFVCAHGSRDQRCGSCGPALIETLKKEIGVRGLEDQIFVRACSHCGGHKYAGNVIVFGSSGTGTTVSGHWYGYVSPGDVPLILDQHIGKGKIIEHLWRGQMGVTGADQKSAQQSRLANSEGEGNSNCCHSRPDQANDGNQCGGGSGCCQTSSERVTKEVKENRIPDFLVSVGSSSLDGALIFPEDEDTDEEPTDPRIPLWGNYFIPLPKWVQNWEKEDSNAALAVIGAAAAITVAIRLWRESYSSSS